MKLKERRQKISKALDVIVERFKEIDSSLTPFHKQFGIRQLDRENRLNYLPVPGYEGIRTEYADKDGNIIEINISYKNKK
jgi:hypothetical protein